MGLDFSITPKIIILFGFIEKSNPIRIGLSREEARVGPGWKAKGGSKIIILFGFVEKSNPIQIGLSREEARVDRDGGGRALLRL